MPPGSRRWKEIDQKIDADHQARLVVRQAAQLDLPCVQGLYHGRGRQAFEPAAMLRMVLFMMLQGFGSPAQWYEQAKFNEVVQWLGYGYQPARRTWYEFRDRLSKCIETLHVQLIHNALCPPEHCLSCVLARDCARDPAKGRTVTRMEGQELLDAQREKREQPDARQRYKLRGQTVKLGFPDAKGNRRFDRYHGHGLSLARTETGLMVLAQNAMRLDRLQHNALSAEENSA